MIKQFLQNSIRLSVFNLLVYNGIEKLYYKRDFNIKNNMYILISSFCISMPSYIIRKQIVDKLTLKFTKQSFKELYLKNSRENIFNYMLNKYYFLFDLSINRFLGEFITFISLQKLAEVYYQQKQNDKSSQWLNFIRKMILLEIFFQYTYGFMIIKKQQTRQMIFPLFRLFNAITHQIFYFQTIMPQEKKAQINF